MADIKNKPTFENFKNTCKIEFTTKKLENSLGELSPSIGQGVSKEVERGI